MARSKKTRRRKKMGRPSKLTPALSARMVKRMQGGLYLETAAQLEGLPPKTVRGWLAIGANSKAPADQLYRDFRNATEAALARSEQVSLDHITRAAEPRTVATVARTKAVRYVMEGGKRRRVVETTETTTTRRDDGDWKAALSYLERRFPDRWAPSVRVRYETEQQLGDIFRSLKTFLDDATYRRVLDALDRAADAEEGSGEGAPHPPATDPGADSQH